MSLQTRGSATLEKAQRRLANLKSIDENLDLGYGLTIANYLQMIKLTRAAIESHNTLISNIDESRRNVSAIEKALSEMSGKMLASVAIRYGKSSIEYSKAGGTVRKNRSTSSPTTYSAPTPTQALFTHSVPNSSKLAVNGATNGSRSKQSGL